MNMNVETVKQPTVSIQEGHLSSNDQFFLQSVIDEVHRVTPLRRFKAMFAEAGKKLYHNQQLDDMVKQQIQQDFRHIIHHMSMLLYHTPRFSEAQRELVGQWLYQEFMAFCLLGTWSERSLKKPQSIAGDHFTIDQIYKHGNQEKSILGHLVNHCFFEEPACKAVINRKQYMEDLLLANLEKQTGDEPLRVSSIASGPAEELFAVYEQLGKDGASRLKAAGIDIDKRACAAVDDRIQANKLSRHFSTFSHDIFKFDPAAHKLADQDIVYSMGLFDYFKDRLAIRVINKLHKMLKPGGTVIIGNFHVSCSSRVFLDYLLDWPLIYRTEQDMVRLFEQSDFAGSEVIVDFEPEGINMLVHCKKS